MSAGVEQTRPARSPGSTATPEVAADDAGTRLCHAIATPERAVRVIGDLVGDRLTFGPVPAGPGGMATATAEGRVGRLSGSADGATAAAHHVTVVVPVDLDLAVEVGRRSIPVEARLAVRIGLRPCLSADGSQVVVEVDTLGPGDIDVTTRASGVGGVVVRRLGDLDDEIRHHVIRWVTDLLDTEAAHAARHLPVG